MQRDGDYWPAVTVGAGSRVCNARISVTHCAAASLGNASTAVTPSGDAESTLAYLLRGHLTYSACCVLHCSFYLQEGIGAHEENQKKKEQSPDSGRHASARHA